jgi:hypothetical protein
MMLGWQNSSYSASNFQFAELSRIGREDSVEGGGVDAEGSGDHGLILGDGGTDYDCLGLSSVPDFTERLAAMLKKILVNQYEEKTFDVLVKQAGGEQALVFSKLSLKEVLPFESADLSRELRDFCWRGHFDFVVTDSEFVPLFAVEFDGWRHRAEEQMARDRKKDELSRIFSLPLLRINSRYLEPSYRGTDLLSWFAECFFINRAFTDAEEKGWISAEDGFSPMSVAVRSGEGLLSSITVLGRFGLRNIPLRKKRQDNRCRLRVAIHQIPQEVGVVVFLCNHTVEYCRHNPVSLSGNTTLSQAAP